MWWVKDHPNHSRGGFQDRDVGRTVFDYNYGPDYGVDYARFADPPNLFADARLLETIERTLNSNFSLEPDDIEIIVRNGFVILKGSVSDSDKKTQMGQKVSVLPGVIEVINHLSVPH